MEHIKSQIKIKYDSVKNNIKGTNINVKNIDKEYLNTVNKITDEYANFNKNESHYGIFSSKELKERKLNAETTKIYNDFLNKIKYYDTDHALINREQRQFNSSLINLEKIKQEKIINMMNAGLVLFIDNT